MVSETVRALDQLRESMDRNVTIVPPPLCYDPEDPVYHSIEDFFSYFQTYAQRTYGNNEMVWLQVLPGFLVGEQRNIVNAFGLGTNIKYATVKQRLIRELSFNDPSNSWYTRFFAMERRVSESLTCFMIRLEVAAANIPGFSEAAQKDFVQTKFLMSLDAGTVATISSLKEKEVSNGELARVAKAIIESFGETINNVGEVNNVHGTTAPSKPKIIVNRKDILPNNNKPRQRRCWNCRSKQHLKAACKTKRKNVGNTAAHTSFNGPPRTQRVHINAKPGTNACPQSSFHNRSPAVKHGRIFSGRVERESRGGSGKPTMDHKHINTDNILLNTAQAIGVGLNMWVPEIGSYNGGYRAENSLLLPNARLNTDEPVTVAENPLGPTIYDITDCDYGIKWPNFEADADSGCLGVVEDTGDSSQSSVRALDWSLDYSDCYNISGSADSDILVPASIAKALGQNITYFGGKNDSGTYSVSSNISVCNV